MALGVLRSTFRRFGREMASPARLVEHLSSALYDEWSGTPYVTCIVARVDMHARTLVAVNGREFSAERLKDAVAATSKGQPLDLLVRTGDMYRTFRVDYRDGLKYPHLERIAGTQDRLIAILSARK